MPKAIREAGPLAVASASTSENTIPIVLISPGWGSSGYYSASVLENAAKAKVFAKDLHLYLDHPGEAESYDRPERSVRDLAATLAADAVWDGTQLVGEAIPFGAAAQMLADKEFASAIGLSIRAYAESTIGEAEGRKGQIITNIDEAISIDFVTKAGRGGRVLVELMESARPSQVVERAVSHGVTEATANDTRDALHAALKDAYGGEKSWAWVRDFDEATVWFQLETPDGTDTYAETYELESSGAVILAGSPIEVRPRTEYVPVKPAAESGATDQTPNVPAPAGQSTATESEETHMATTQIEESRLAQLEKDAERVQSLESERDTAKAELATFKARESARPAIIKAVGESSLPAISQARLVESVLAGVAADTTPEQVADATKAAVEAKQAEMAELAEALGVGRIHGFGSTVTESTGYSVEDFDAAFNSTKEA